MLTFVLDCIIVNLKKTTTLRTFSRAATHILDTAL